MERISWDEAIDIIAHKMMEAREKYGAESVMASTGGGGNPHFRMIARFCNIFGTPNWYEPGCAQCFLPRTLAFGMMYGGPSTSIADECALEIYNKNTPMKNIVLWGTDVSYSCPAGGGHALANLRAKGVKTVSVDPRLRRAQPKPMFGFRYVPVLMWLFSLLGYATSLLTISSTKILCLNGQTCLIWSTQRLR